MEKSKGSENFPNALYLCRLASIPLLASQLNLSHNHIKQLKWQKTIYIFVCFTLDYIAISLDISITMTLINAFAWLREAVSLFTFIQIARWRSPKKRQHWSTGRRGRQQGLDKPQLFQTKCSPLGIGEYWIWPFACEANVITTTLLKLQYKKRKSWKILGMPTSLPHIISQSEYHRKSHNTH